MNQKSGIDDLRSATVSTVSGNAAAVQGRTLMSGRRLPGGKLSSALAIDAIWIFLAFAGGVPVGVALVKLI